MSAAESGGRVPEGIPGGSILRLWSGGWVVVRTPVWMECTGADAVVTLTPG